MNADHSYSYKRGSAAQLRHAQKAGGHVQKCESRTRSAPHLTDPKDKHSWCLVDQVTAAAAKPTPPCWSLTQQQGCSTSTGARQAAPRPKQHSRIAARHHVPRIAGRTSALANKNHPAWCTSRLDPSPHSPICMFALTGRLLLGSSHSLLPQLGQQLLLPLGGDARLLGALQGVCRDTPTPTQKAPQSSNKQQ